MIVLNKWNNKEYTILNEDEKLIELKRNDDNKIITINKSEFNFSYSYVIKKRKN